MKILVGILVLIEISRFFHWLGYISEMKKYKENHNNECLKSYICPNYGNCKNCDGIYEY